MSIQYSVISGRTSHSQVERDLRLRAINVWKPFWTGVYASVNSNYLPKTDDFLRQDFITILEVEREIAALLCFSFYDTQCPVVTQHSYLQFYNEEFFTALRAKGVGLAMTMEYLSVQEKFRKSSLGYSAASVILSLGIEFFGRTRAEAIIGTARNDVKANLAAYQLGFECVLPATKQRNFECDLVMCRQRQPRLPEDMVFRRAFKEAQESRVVHPGAQILVNAWERAATEKTQAA